MRAWTRQHLVCPACRRGYAEEVARSLGADVLDAVLTCPDCAVAVPVLDGFPLFTEASLGVGDLDALRARLFGDPGDYAAHEARKAARGSLDAYAAFHPFNESTRVIEATLPLLERALRPGDLILDVWCRTGWSGEWLAARFPEQRVISLWESDAGVLGYRGFRRWLGPERRAPNLDIVFARPDRPLPFPDGAFKALHAADLLHRYDLVPFVSESLRVTAEDGLALFPHVHLSNSEPTPFFERGGTKRHGREYRAWLDRLETTTHRRGRVLSEITLFEQSPACGFEDEAETTDYNGFVLIAGAGAGLLEPTQLAHKGTAEPQGHLLLNPLFRLSFARGSARVDHALHDGVAGHLLDRHPVYERRLPRQPVALSGRDFLTLALAAAGASVAAIRSALGVEDALLQRLIETELLRPATVAPAMVELQRFHAAQRPSAARETLLDQLLTGLAADGVVRVKTAEGDAIAGQELAHAIALAAEAGIPPALASAKGPAGLSVILAAMATGQTLDLASRRGPEAQDLIAALDPGKDPAPLVVRDAARLRLECDGGPVELDADLLLEAAASIRFVTASGDLPSADLADGPTLLAALVALMAGEAVSFGV